MRHYIYKIVIDKIIRYIGITENLERRQYQHNNLLNKDNNKELYKQLKAINISKIKLIEIKQVKDKQEAKRYECLLILKDYFNKKQLWQSVPHITDKPF
jgi:predicted GIY-YIG superfamily endonuclease